MSGLFTVVAIDGDFTDFMSDMTMPYLRYSSLDWSEALQLCELSFHQGFQCVVIKQDDGEEVGGTGDGKKESGGKM